jgi:ssDNA-binding protein
MMAQANSGNFKAPEARLSFSDGLWEPVSQGTDGSDKKYGCTLIWHKKHREALLKPVRQVVHYKWGSKGLVEFDAGRIKCPIFSGTDKQAYSASTGERWAGFDDDCIFIRAKNNDDAPPKIFWRSQHIQATREEVYSGCYGVPILNAYSWEHPTGGRGVTFNINMFRKTRDAESLGGRRPLTDSEIERWFVEIEPEVEQGEEGAGDFFN